MKIKMKLGTLSGKTYDTKEYKSIEVGDYIELLIQGKYQNVKIWKIDDKIYGGIPILYFGEYL